LFFVALSMRSGFVRIRVVVLGSQPQDLTMISEALNFEKSSDTRHCRTSLRTRFSRRFVLPQVRREAWDEVRGQASGQVAPEVWHEGRR